MSLKHFAAAAGAVAMVALASHASAADFAFNIDLDPTTLTSGSFNIGVLPSPTDIGVGDTVDLLITFGGQTVTLSGGSDIWTALLAGDDASIQTQGVLSFIGGSSNLHTTDPVTQENLYVHAGNFYGNGDFASDSNSFSFTGLEQKFTILSNDEFPINEQDPIGPDPRTYNTAFFYYDGTATLGGGAPEPAAWALMIAGFGLCGAALRRRRPDIAEA